ncbi:MAG: NupC/NupG family nucleoside CNT transporter [bacterium]|nr:NupC/NupG family nucleoside CNT transporter [bacterium]MCP5068297.1 NupC/NupG family nucleoside CNT transporter [bacterium]
MSDPGLRLTSAFGLLAMIAVAWAFSEHRRRLPWRVIGWGLGLQLTLAVLLLKTAPGQIFFRGVNDAVLGFLQFTEAGTTFMFGPIKALGFSFVLDVLPIILFMGSIFSILYHWGIVQRVIDGMALVLQHTLRTSAAESLAAAANIFVGMTEAPLLVRPYLERMTRSELFTVMVTGMATIAGSVLVAYAKMLGEGEFSGHLVTASLLSAPAAILIAKVMVPETETPLTIEAGHATVERTSVNWIDAASQGALAALRLAGYIGALLLCFVALIALINAFLGTIGGLVGMPDLTLQQILGLLFWPLALLLGVDPGESFQVAQLLGVKTVLNEFLAFDQLSGLMADGAISHRSAVITSYALCGFANFGSLAILLGGIGGMAPSRRPELATLGLRSILAGTLATLMTGCVVGILL